LCDSRATLADYVGKLYTCEELLFRLPFSNNGVIRRRDEGRYEIGQCCAAANGIQQSRNKVKSPEMGEKAHQKLFADAKFFKQSIQYVLALDLACNLTKPTIGHAQLFYPGATI
jgi:hypothetical protein